MPLIKLDIHALRNISALNLVPAKGLNFLVGANASGKSSILEALFILSRSRSFRTNHLKQAIQFDQEQLVVSALKQHSNGSLSTLGISATHKETTIRIDQEPKLRADLAYNLPVQLIQPKSYQLLDAGPQFRREFIDWGVFNQQAQFLTNWRCFSKALQQRNALLKSKQTHALSAWDKEFALYGETVSQYRKDYMQALQPVFLTLARHFLECDAVELVFYPGWDSQYSLDAVLEIDRARDLKYGFTHNGPHRSDFVTHVNTRPAKDYLSRGQQKLLMLALLIAQASLMNQHNPNQSLILIDDLSAELDTENKAKLLKYLDELGCQVFITATGLEDLGDLSMIPQYQVFHVKQGSLENR